MSRIISLFAVLLLITSCKKSVPDNINETLPTGTTIATGSFSGNAHSTSGTVKIVKDAAGKTYLVIENLQTADGPDLHIWLSPNNNASPYQEIGLLKAVSGNFSYELPASVNHMVNNRVLIWCKSFSSLFGNALLQ